MSSLKICFKFEVDGGLPMERLLRKIEDWRKNQKIFAKPLGQDEEGRHQIILNSNDLFPLPFFVKNERGKKISIRKADNNKLLARATKVLGGAWFVQGEGINTAGLWRKSSFPTVDTVNKELQKNVLEKYNYVHEAAWVLNLEAKQIHTARLIPDF